MLTCTMTSATGASTVEVDFPSGVTAQRVTVEADDDVDDVYEFANLLLPSLHPSDGEKYLHMDTLTG